MKLPIERFLWVGVVALVAIGSVAGGLGYVTLQRLNDHQRTVTATYEVLGALDDLVIQLDTAEHEGVRTTN